VPAARAELAAHRGDALAAAGTIDDAVAVYRGGLVGLPRGDQRALDLRRRAIAALDRAGRTDAATAELEAAVRAAPRELALAFELARRYGPARGVAVLVRIEGDHPLDANVLAVVGDRPGAVAR